MTTSPSNLNRLIAELFRRHGVGAVPDGEWVLLPASRIKVEAEVVQETVHPRSRVVQLDVRVRIGLGRVIVESFAGIGGTTEEAVRDALEAFTRGSFHVLLRTLVAASHDDGQVSQEDWTADGRPRRATIGGLVIRGQVPDLGDRILDCYRDIERRLKATPFPDGVHWVRLCYLQAGGERLECEVLRDNEPWDELQTAVEAAPWPREESFYSARVFLILQGGLEVSRAADAIARHSDLEDEPLIAALIEEGFSHAAAERAVVFIPTAFGDALLKRMSVKTAEAITLRNPNTGEERTVKRGEEPVYAEALRLAEEGYFERGWMAREEFESVALRSAMVNAVNEALTAGSRPEDLEPSRSIAYLDRLDPLDPTMEHMPPLPAITARPPERPWWRPW